MLRLHIPFQNRILEKNQGKLTKHHTCKYCILSSEFFMNYLKASKTIIHAAAILAVTLLILITGCHNEPDLEIISDTINRDLVLNMPLYCCENHNGQTSVYRIPVHTKDIERIITREQGILDLKCSESSVYLLRKDRDGYLYVTRMETDFDVATEAIPATRIKSDSASPWGVSRDGTVILFGSENNGTSKIIELEFMRTEGDEIFEPGKESYISDPEITFIESEIYSTQSPIYDAVVSPDDSQVAASIGSADSGDGATLAMRSNSGQWETLPGNNLKEIGGFSPDGNKLVATMEVDARIEVFLVDTGSHEKEQLTVSPRYFYASHPRWHPNGNYIIYTVNFTDEIKENDAVLESDQLYLYSLVSGNERRLTAFEGQSIYVDFAPTGDFLIYSLNKWSRGRSRSALDTEHVDPDSLVETWRLNYVPWDPQRFQSGTLEAMQQDQTFFLVSWQVNDSQQIRFSWGPG